MKADTSRVELVLVWGVLIGLSIYTWTWIVRAAMEVLR